MMKKLLLLCTAIFAFNTVAKSQQVNDTLRYFLYKQAYKIAPSSTVHPTYKLKAGVVTNTAITHVGSIFRNSDPNLLITGLETRLLRPNLSVSGVPNGVPLRLYLCKLGTNGLPMLPAIDSITAGVLNNSNVQYGQYVGASFTSTNAPYNMTGDFAILIKNVSTYDGDTVKVFRTSAYTPTATNAPSNNNKIGEGLGVIRNGGVFYKTTNYNDPNFGPGTDYEFCMAPMIQFTLQVSQIASPTQEGACEWEVFTNTNTSSPELTNKQFNFNEFARQWAPLNQTVTAGYTPDEVLAWDLGDGQAPYYLPMNTDTIQLAYASGISNQFFNGTMCGKYKQSAYSIDMNHASIERCDTYTASSVWCNDSMGSSIHEMGPLAKVKIYPNPTVDKTIIKGLEGQNTISVYNMMGQLVATEVTNEEIYTVNLLNQPQGNYLIRINNVQNYTRVVKIVRQ